MTSGLSVRWGITSGLSGRWGVASGLSGRWGVTSGLSGRWGVASGLSVRWGVASGTLSQSTHDPSLSYFDLDRLQCDSLTPSLARQMMANMVNKLTLELQQARADTRAERRHASCTDTPIPPTCQAPPHK